MTSTQFTPCFFDVYIGQKMDILPRIIWHYDTSGVQAKKYFGSLYEPVLSCVKDDKNYCFNAEEILVEAKTGAKREINRLHKTRFRSIQFYKSARQCLGISPCQAWRRKGDVILYPLSGTFTTSFACNELKRKPIGTGKGRCNIGARRVFNIYEHEGKSIKRRLRIYETSGEYEQMTLFERAAYHG
jgi:site-specific DNA-methyltransferase (adenine-specific)